MFASYDLKEFSSNLRRIREELGYSRDYVSEVSLINVDTLRKLEIGKTIPRFDTLEILSEVYSVNLLLLLNKYKSNSSLMDIYEFLDYFMVSNNSKVDEETINEYRNFLEVNKNSDVFNTIEREQFEKFFFIVLSSMKGQITNKKTKDKLIEIIRLNHKDYTLNNYKDFNITFLEIRILITICNKMILIDENKLAREILIYIKDKLTKGIYTDLFKNRLLCKTLELISLSYIYESNYNDSIDYAQDGIDISIENEEYTSLANLYFRVAVCKYYLKHADYKKYFKESVYTLIVLNEDQNIKDYILASSFYGIEESDFDSDVIKKYTHS